MKIRNMKQVTERVKGLKGRKLFRRNQIIITTLAVMIAAAGYLNYAGKRDLEAGSRLRGRPDGGKPGGTVRNGFGHFKSGQ